MGWLRLGWESNQPLPTPVILSERSESKACPDLRRRGPACAFSRRLHPHEHGCPRVRGPHGQVFARGVDISLLRRGKATNLSPIRHLSEREEPKDLRSPLRPAYGRPQLSAFPMSCHPELRHARGSVHNHSCARGKPSEGSAFVFLRPIHPHEPGCPILGAFYAPRVGRATNLSQLLSS